MSKEIKLGVKIEGTHLVPIEGPIRKTVGYDKHGYIRYRYYFKCQCDCGNVVLIRRDGLQGGNTATCDKCHDGDPRRLDPDIKKHYLLAKNIRKRCRDAAHTPTFYGYGGRGIECELGDTIIDIAESIKKVPGYFDGAQLDRINNDGNYSLYNDKYKYEPYTYKDPVTGKIYQAIGNLRWVTNEDNVKNRFISYRVDYNKISNRLMSCFTLRMVCKREKFNISDFLMVKFPLKGKNKNSDLYLFIHKTMQDDLESKIIRILNLYYKYGKYMTVRYNGKIYKPDIIQKDKEEIELDDSEEE